MINISFIKEALADLKDQKLYRKLKTLEPVSSVRARFEGRELILFCGNDYLGLTHHPKVIKTFQEAAVKYGAGAGAARLISGTTSIHTELENKIAEHKKKEKALIYSAGYLANLGVLSALAGEGDLILMDKLCHASLVDGARLSGAELRVFPHKNYERAEEILSQSKSPRKLLVSDTVFSMDGDRGDVEALAALKAKYGALLILDDAHVTGVFPDEEGNHVAAANFLAKADVITGTLSKALGVIGGFAAGSSDMIEYLINFSRPFIFATAIPPAVCSAAFESLKIAQEGSLRKKLWQNIRLFQALLKKNGFEVINEDTPIFPIVLGSEQAALEASDKLLKAGFLVPAIRYPTVPKGKARLRVTVSAAHEPADLAAFMEALVK